MSSPPNPPPTIPPPHAVDALIGRFHGRSILSITQFSREDLETLMALASQFGQLVNTRGTCELLSDRVLATIFYEPSTRTSSSFQAAMMRLGGKVLSIPDVMQSSVSKGETIEDTMRCLECYVDAIVMRHPSPGSVQRAADSVRIPVLNAGDGIGEHPTQALLDLYTIQCEAGRTDQLVVTLMGDLLHGRTVHSLAKLLTRFTGITLHLVSPPSLAMPDDVVSFVSSIITTSTHPTLTRAILSTTDVLYVTRIQKERFSSLDAYTAATADYALTPELLDKLGGTKSTMRIMHPLPRVNELDVRLDTDDRAAYFRQMRYGLFVRMALLAVVFGRRMEDEWGVVQRKGGLQGER